MTNTKETTIKVVRDERGRFAKKTGWRFFKKGQRVIVTESTSRFYSKGDTGIVMESGNPDRGIMVQFDQPCTYKDGFWCAGANGRLEILDESKPKPTPAPRPFKIGDVVRLSADGKQKWPHEPYNPHDAIGRVIGFYNDGDGLDIRVKWNSDKTNAYAPLHLELVPNTPKQRKVEKKAQTIEVPEEIPAALQTLAKVFGYRVEKA